VEEEYWWAITQATGRSCCDRSGSIALQFEFQPHSLFIRTHTTIRTLSFDSTKYDLHPTFRKVTKQSGGGGPGVA
jgi:hypothetical protein